MNYRGKMQQGGPIDPKVLEQMNRYQSGMSGDIIQRKPQLGAVKHQDSEEAKKNKQISKYRKLKAVGYTDKEARSLSLHEKTLPAAQDKIDEMEATNHRISMHPDYNPNIPFEQQTDLLNDNSLRTRILRGRNEFMNSSSGNGIIDFLAKGIASPGSSFANMTMDAENQYVKPGVKQGLFNLGMDALNVFPNETAGLVNKGYQKLRPNVKNNFRPSENIETVTDQIAKNLEDLQYAKEKFGDKYTIPENLERIAKSKVLTDRTIRGLVNRDNTFVRGVSTNWKELEKYSPSALEHLKKVGIDYIKNPKQAAEYMATHIPPQTGYGRAGMKSDMFNANLDGLYTSNSKATAEGYTYGDGYIVKVKKPTDFSSTNRQEWIEKNKVNYIQPKRLSESDVNKLDEFKMNNNDIMNSYHKKRYEEAIPDIKKAEDAKDWLKKQQIEIAWAKKAEDDFNKYAAEQTGLDKKLGFNIDYKPGDIIKTSAKKTISPKQLGVGDKNINIRKIHEEILPKLDLSAVKRLNLENDLGDLAGELRQTGLKSPEIAEKLKSYLADKYNNPYAHYIHLGNPGQKIFESISSTEMNLFNYKNKSRAHTGTYSKGLSAAALAAPIVGNFLSQQDEEPKKGFKEGGQINMKYRPKMQTGGSQPKMQTAGFPPKSEDYMDDYEGYQSAMDNWVQSTYDPEAQGLKGLKDFLGRRQKGLPTNMFKTTGNEGTDSNPMDRGPVETGPVETSPDQKETSKIDPYWAFRGLRSGISWLSGMVERGRQNRYDWMQQTALGQMNPMPTDDFQPNPYNLYMQKGGNLKTIIKDYNKYTNDAQMDMGDGKLDDKGRMQKGGRAPIYTDNPNDPRLRAYNDSLALYQGSNQSRINNLLKQGFKYDTDNNKPINTQLNNKDKQEFQKNMGVNPKKGLQKIIQSGNDGKRDNAMGGDSDLKAQYELMSGKIAPIAQAPLYDAWWRKSQYLQKTNVGDLGAGAIQKNDKDVRPNPNYGKPLARDKNGEVIRNFFNVPIYKKPVQPVVYQPEPKFEKPIPIPRKTDLVDFSSGRMPTPSAPDLQQAVYDNTKPTNYSYTYPTGKYNEQKVIYFPDENLLRNFADKQYTTSIQSTGNQATATGTLKMKKGGYEIDKMMIMGNILPKLLQMGRLGTSKYRRMKEGGLTANKAREILHDGTVHGKKLTDKQRRYFGAMSKGHTNFRGK